MYLDFDFRDVLASSVKAAGQVEDVLPAEAKLDFGRRLLPEALARTDGPAFPRDDWKPVLNRIRGHEHLKIFGVAEELFLPFVLDHARPRLNGDGHRVRAIAGLYPVACDRIAAVAPAFG